MKAYKRCGFPVEEGGTPRQLIPPTVRSKVQAPGIYLTSSATGSPSSP
jgi:hypothetical protein